MKNPFNITVDWLGNLFVADYSNNRVIRFNDPKSKGNGGSADNLLGQPSFGLSGSGFGPNRFNYPCSVSVDNEGNRLFVADCFNHRVLVFEGASTLTDGQEASLVLGQPNPSTGNQSNQGKPISDANTLNNPTCVLFDWIHNMVWIADPSNHRVLGFC